MTVTKETPEYVTMTTNKPVITFIKDYLFILKCNKVV